MSFELAVIKNKKLFLFYMLKIPLIVWRCLLLIFIKKAIEAKATKNAKNKAELNFKLCYL